MADEIQKSIDALRKVEEERLALQKKQFEESVEDRKERVDKKAFEAQVKQFEKVADIEKQASNLSEKSFARLEKGVLAKSLKANKKNAEVQTALFSLTKERNLQALAIAAERRKEKRLDSSILARTGRVVAAFQANLLSNTQVGRAILLKTLQKSGKTSVQIQKILDKGIDNDVEFKRELIKLREGLVEKFKNFTGSVKSIKDKVLKGIQLIFDPLSLIKVIAGLSFKLIIKPLTVFLGKKIIQGIKLPLKGLDFLFGKLLKRRLGTAKKAKPGTGLLARSEERRERERRERREGGKFAKLLDFLKLGFLRKGGAAAGGLLAAGGAAVGAAGRGIAQGVGAGAGFLGLRRLAATPVARVIGKVVLPIAAIGSGVLAGFEEFKKTKDIQKAIGEGLVDATRVLSFGLIDKEELRDKLKKPFLGIVEGITGFLDGELSPKNFRSIGEGFTKLAAAPFDIAFKMGTNITEFVARKFGAKEFADEVDRLFKNVNFGEGLVEAVDSIVKVFTKATAENFRAATVEIDTEAIATIKSLKALDNTIAGLREGLAASTMQLQNLSGEEQEAAAAQQQATIGNLTATVKRRAELLSRQAANTLAASEITTGIELSQQIAANANLKDKAAQRGPVVLPVPAPAATPPQIMPASPIIAPIAQRNPENTFRRIIQQDFTGTQG